MSSLLPLTLLALAPLACSAAPPPAPQAAASLRPIDGAVYDVTLEFPGAAPVNDTFVFAFGKFESKALTAIGFPRWTAYETRVDHGETTFHVTEHHPEGETVEWQGSVEDDGIAGTAVGLMEGTVGPGHFKGIARR